MFAFTVRRDLCDFATQVSNPFPFPYSRGPDIADEDADPDLPGPPAADDTDLFSKRKHGSLASMATDWILNCVLVESNRIGCICV